MRQPSVHFHSSSNVLYDSEQREIDKSWVAHQIRERH